MTHAFRILATDSKSNARVTSYTLRGVEIITPIFMPVATVAATRAQTQESLWNSGSRILLANTYHLLLRPGLDVFRALGGIHNFMRWPGLVLTDSGGFQVFSMESTREISEAGAKFRSYVDGSYYLLSPETSIQAQEAIASDIMMAFDQCIPAKSERAVAQVAMTRTHAWALRSLEARKTSAKLFAIVQGGLFEDLRTESALFLREQPFDGFAIGGLAVGESRQERNHFTRICTTQLPTEKPRYLMGVGTPIDLLEAVHNGVDMFDCILPTAQAQTGIAFTMRGRLDLNRSVYKLVQSPLEDNCGCLACSKYSMAYLHHLVKCREYLGWHLLGQHNLYFYHRLMQLVREQIMQSTFADFFASKAAEIAGPDPEFPVTSPIKKRGRLTSRGNLEIVQNSAGFYTLAEKSSGEVMHSVNPPLQEAEQLYLQQSKILERLQSTADGSEPLVLWDVGLGAGFSLMTTILAAEKIKLARPLKIISFENNLDGFRLALDYRQNFAHLKHAAADNLLKKSSWHSKDGQIECQLVVGDFTELHAAQPKADVIYFDPYSRKANPKMWSLTLFEALAQQHCGSKTILITYSCSNLIRARLLAAGFWVAQGVASGPKVETSLALTPAALSIYNCTLLGPEWICRWQKSGANLEFVCANDKSSSFSAEQLQEAKHLNLRIFQHPQF